MNKQVLIALLGCANATKLTTMKPHCDLKGVDCPKLNNFSWDCDCKDKPKPPKCEKKTIVINVVVDVPKTPSCPDPPTTVGGDPGPPGPQGPAGPSGPPGP